MLRRHLMAAGLATAATMVAAATPALAGGGLRWNSPRTVTSGTPIQVASVDACPPLPNPGDTMLVQVTLLFDSGGGSGQLITPNADGSWSGSVTFGFSGTGSRGQLSAACLDDNGTGATAYAQYAVHRVKLG